MVGTRLIDPVDTGANFSQADLTAATIRQPFEAVSAGRAPIFDDAILTGAKLLGEYGGASFRDAILMQTAIQRGSDFVAADFTSASLVDITGRPDNMCGTTFESADSWVISPGRWWSQTSGVLGYSRVRTSLTLICVAQTCTACRSFRASRSMVRRCANPRYLRLHFRRPARSTS